MIPVKKNVYDIAEEKIRSGGIEADNKYKFWLDYLVKMICLSRCKYLIAADTAGSRFAHLFNNGKYAGKYIFRLGVY